MSSKRHAKRISNQKCRIPKELESLTTQFSDEVDPESVGMKAHHVGRLWRHIESLYRSGMYPAITFCLRRHGKIVLNRGIGHRRGNGPDDALEAPKELVTHDTPICLFSASKMITAMVIHGLAERGVLHLMDPVSYYLPKFAVTGKGDLNIYHLLTHRAGIPAMPKVESIEVFLDHAKVRELVHDLEPKWMSGRGAGYHAASSGFVLGEIAEKVTGKDLRQLLQEMIQVPMDMPFFNFGVEEAHWRQVAVNYLTGIVPTPFADTFLQRLLGAPLEQVVELSNDPRFYSAIIPAGNILATAEEVSRFLQMMLDMGSYKGRQIFSPLTIRRAIQEVGKPEFDRMFLAPMRYSAGFMLGANPLGMWGFNSAQAFGHLGFTNNICWADRQRDISVAFLSTGNPLLGGHLPSLGLLMTAIGRYCRPMAKF